MKQFFYLGLLLSLAACAGRLPEPVAVEQTGDLGLRCLVIDAEIGGNKERAAMLATQDDDAEAYNMAVGLTSFALFLPGLLSLDMSDAETVEIAALEERNAYLETIGMRKGCHVQALVPPGYASFDRQRQRFIDENGRFLDISVNRFTYNDRIYQATKK